MVDEEDLQFHEEYMNEQDPSILHFLLASGDDVWYIYIRKKSIDVLNIHIASMFNPSTLGIQQAAPWWSDDNAHSWPWDLCSSLDMDILSSI
jgi:hypothetical protein